MGSFVLNNQRYQFRRDGPNSFLFVNGSSLWMNDVATNLIENISEFSVEGKLSSRGISSVIKRMRNKYDVGEEVLRNDIKKIISKISGKDFLRSIHVDFASVLSSPINANLALIYRCNNNCYFCYARDSEKKKELNRDQWLLVLDKLFDLNVPNISFSGGEPTIVDFLCDLIDYSKDKFSVVGLVTNGTLLDELLCNKLKKSGLNYIQISIESKSEITHDKITRRSGSWNRTIEGIKMAVNCNLNVSTNTTLTKDNYKDIIDLIIFLENIGVKTICCNSIMGSSDNRLSDEEISKSLKEILLISRRLGVNFRWLSAGCYNILNPIGLGLGANQCTAATVDISIEPDGSVIPCPSWINKSGGNILTDDWSDIWNSKVFEEARQFECHECRWVFQCKGGCHLNRCVKK